MWKLGCMTFEITRESEPDADTFNEGSGVRWHDYVPGAALVGIMLLTFLAHLSEDRPPRQPAPDETPRSR